MKNRLRRFAWAALPLVAAGAFIFWVVRRDAGQTLKLPDGRVLTVKAVTFGTNHFYFEGKPLVKLRRRFLTARRAAELGLRSYRHDTEVPGLVLWAHARSSAEAKATNPARLLVGAVDQDGIEAEPEYGNSIPGQPETLEFFQLLRFPRREKSLRIAVYELDATAMPRRVGELRIHNPAARNYPKWFPTLMPASVRDDKLEFTLTDLLINVNPITKSPASRGPISPWTEAKFRVVENGAASTNWTVAAINASDATGNDFTLRSLVCQLEGDAVVTRFREVLWPGEPAWKLRVEFSRAAGFAPDELIVLPNLPVPPLGKSVTNMNPFRVQDTLISSVEATTLGQSELALPGEFRPNLHLSLATPGTFAGVRLSLLRATDERGRAAHFYEGYPTPGRRFSFGLVVPRDARTLDLTLAIRRSRFAEFTIKPRLQRAPPASSAP